MSIKDKVLARVDTAMTTEDGPDELELAMIRTQEIVDKSSKTDFEFISLLANTYHGRMALIQNYNQKWFIECLYSQPVLDNILEALISAVESAGDNSVRVPNIWLTLFNGKSTITPEADLAIQAQNSIHVLDRQSQAA